VSKQFAEELMRPLGATVGFYLAGELVISSSATVLDREVLTEYGKLAASPAALETDCRTGQPFTVSSGTKRMTAVIARLPGEARFADAFFAVYLEEAPTTGLATALDRVRKDDLGFGNFPWQRRIVGHHHQVPALAVHRREQRLAVRRRHHRRAGGGQGALGDASGPRIRVEEQDSLAAHGHRDRNRDRQRPARRPRRIMLAPAPGPASIIASDIGRTRRSSRPR
jgi:hypothetical protein